MCFVNALLCAYWHAQQLERCITNQRWSEICASAYHCHFLITSTPHPLFASTDQGELRYLSSLIGIGSYVCIQAAFVCFRKLAV